MVVKFREIVRLIALRINYFIYTTVYGMDISDSARVSLGVRLDKTFPEGIHVGENSYIASGAIIFSHDFSRGIRAHTQIGKHCFIGANVIVMAGVSIGDSVVVGSGSVVTKNVLSNCIVVGNPARIVRENIKTGRYGKIL